MLLPIYIDTRRDSKAELAGSVTVDKDGKGLHVKMAPGFGLTVDDAAQLFGMAGVQIRRTERTDDGKERIMELTIREFSLDTRTYYGGGRH